MKTILINKYFGRVCRISANRAEITIRLPSGGKINCKNEGFEVGDEVCFILNGLQQVTKVIPKYIANAIAQLGSDPIADSIIHTEKLIEEIEEMEETERNEYETRENPYYNRGQVFEKNIDTSSNKNRNPIEGREDNYDVPIDLEITMGTKD